MAAITHKELKLLRRQNNDSLSNAVIQAEVVTPTQVKPTAPIRKSKESNMDKEAKLYGYPPGSTDPKLFIPHKTARGWIPRTVALSRVRDQYDSSNLIQLLRDAGIDYFKVTPGGTIPDAPSSDSVFHSYLPLEAFDDDAFDERSPEDWLSLGVDTDGCFKFVPGLALRQDDVERGRWRPCKILDWNAIEYRLLVEWHDVRRRVWLPRVHVMFIAENPEVHATRVIAAHKSRKETEAILRYHLYVDSMPIDDLEPLEPSQLERIRDLSINTNCLLENEESLNVSSVVQEVNTDYSRTLNRIVFDINLRDPAQAPLFQGVSMPTPQPPPPVPQFAQVCCSSVSYYALTPLLLKKQT